MRVAYIIDDLFPGEVGDSIAELCRFLIAEGADLRVFHEKNVKPRADLRDFFVATTLQELEDAVQSDDGLEGWQRSDLVLVDYAVDYPLSRAIAQPWRGTKVLICHAVARPREDADVGLGDTARHADHVVVASACVAKALKAQGVPAERIAVIPYCVRPDRFRAGSKSAELRRRWDLEDHFVLLHAGPTAAEKGIDTLVRGLATVRAAGLPAKLLLLQDEPRAREAPKTNELAEQLAVPDHVIFAGNVSDDQLPDYLNLADVFVSEGSHEASHGTLVKAMAAGKPVVAARAGEVPSIVDGAGYLFEPGDGDEMGRAVVRILESAISTPAFPDAPPRLCFVVPRYGIGFAGGAETLCRRWAETCRQAGWTVRVVTTTTSCMIEWNNHFAAGEEVLNGVPVLRFTVASDRAKYHLKFHHRADQDPPRLSPRQQRRWMESGVGPAALFDWLRARRDQFDFFVFVPYLYNTTVLGIDAVGDKALVIPCLHDEGPARTAIVREALDRARAIFFNTTAERDFGINCLGLANPSCFTLGMGIDHPPHGDAAAFREKFGIAGDFFLYCGRLEQGKNVPHLLDYFWRFRKAYGDPVELVLVGTGDIPSHAGVRSLGYLSEADKAGALAAARALINPSVKESFSIVLMESWLQGRPVVVPSDCAVTLEHVRACHGGLWYDDAVQFGAVLHELVSNPALADGLGNQGRSYVQERYSWPGLLERFRNQLDLLRTASFYEELSLRSVLRARYFNSRRYAERWREILSRALPDATRKRANGRPGSLNRSAVGKHKLSRAKILEQAGS